MFMGCETQYDMQSHIRKENQLFCQKNKIGTAFQFKEVLSAEKILRCQ